MTLEIGLNLNASDISPQDEMGAYEALWDERGATFKTIFEKLQQHPNTRPSDLVEPSRARQYIKLVTDILCRAGIDHDHYGIRVAGACEYPKQLLNAEYPLALLYYQGCWDLMRTRSVAVVGNRQASEKGIARTQKLVRNLVDDNFTIMSGLAKGVDTTAHTSAIEYRGRTIAVIGTPINHVYPKENKSLQEKIARDFLLISQVPIKRSNGQGPKQNRLFFPARNVTMSALSEATIIVEAGETSGTLIQAKHALKQQRKLFILESNFQNPNITWPHRFERQGAIRVRDYDDIQAHLLPHTIHSN